MKLTDIRQQNNQIQIFSSGLKSLDKPLAGGFHRGDLISVWSTPLMGTTAFLLSTAYYMARQNIKVLYLTEQNIENWILPRFKASLNKLNFTATDIPLFFETVLRFNNNILENLYKKSEPDMIILDIKPNLQVYNRKLLKDLKSTAQKLNTAIIITTTVQNMNPDKLLNIEDLWKGSLNKKLFDSSDTVLTLYRKIWSLENISFNKLTNKETIIKWQEEIDYYKHRIDVLCYKNIHGNSLWRRHFYFEDCAFVTDKIPVKIYNPEI